MTLADLTDNEKALAHAIIAILNVAYITPRLDMTGVQRVLDAMASEWRIPPAEKRT